MGMCIKSELLLELERISFNFNHLQELMKENIFSFAVALLSGHPYLAVLVVLIASFHLEISHNDFHFRIGK